MKPNFSHFFGFTFLLMTMVFFSARAQEGVPNNEIPDVYFPPELQGEKPLLFEPDRSSSSNDKSFQSREQVSTPSKSAKSKTEAAKNPKQGDDALSFNFLYYIIQKFKISDIVEQ